MRRSFPLYLVSLFLLVGCSSGSESNLFGPSPSSLPMSSSPIAAPSHVPPVSVSALPSTSSGFSQLPDIRSLFPESRLKQLLVDGVKYEPPRLSNPTNFSWRVEGLVDYQGTGYTTPELSIDAFLFQNNIGSGEEAARKQLELITPDGWCSPIEVKQATKGCLFEDTGHKKSTNKATMMYTQVAAQIKNVTIKVVYDNALASRETVTQEAKKITEEIIAQLS